MKTTESEPLPVVVVGAGIIGASIAYYVAKSGTPVTVVDKSLPASGATGASFAWIGKPGGQDQVNASTPLRMQVLDDWRSLSHELPTVVVKWSGSMLWRDSYLSGDYTPISGEQEFLDGATVLEQEPSLRQPPARALHNLEDGAVDPVAVTNALLQGAQHFGARILTNVSVQELATEHGDVTGIETPQGRISARTVVVAAGADAPPLLEPLGVSLPMTPSPVLMIKLTAPPGLIRTIIWSNEVEARQVADGVVLVPTEHHGETTEAQLFQTADRTRRRVASTFDVDLDDLRVVDAQISYRPMPADGLPLMGRLPTIKGVYIVVMHSGLSLAPTVGRLAATELINDVEVDELRLLRPDRAVQ